MMRHTRAYCVMVVAVLLAACTSTPDLKEWAVTSNQLADAVSTENKKILDRMDAGIEERQLADTEGWQTLGAPGDEGYLSLADWKDRRKAYYQNLSDINAVLTVMAAYAASISELAAEGEKGAEAAEKLGGEIGTLAEHIGQSNPLSASVLEGIKAFADLFTRAQAQKSLAAAMRAADDGVDKLAGLLGELANAQKGAAQAIYRNEVRLIDGSAGPWRMQWYKDNAPYAEIERSFAGGDVVKTAAKVALLQALEERYRAKQARLADLRKWYAERKRALGLIPEAAEGWREAHADALAVLEACGGMKSLKASCGNYTAANLKRIVGTIRTITTKDSPADVDGRDG